MKGLDKSVHERLADARGDRVVFLSHCLLDENVRYQGGAFHSGAVPETHALIRTGVGICQMPCPEQRAWGGVTKPQMLRAYGLIDSRLYRFRAVLFGLFLANTRLRYRLLARHVAREIEQYGNAGVAVAGVVGIGASPSCGVHTTLDMRRSFETIAACPLAAIDRAMINERVVTESRVAGEGLFIRALRKQLRRRRIEIPFLEHDLIIEMQGREQPLDLSTDQPSDCSVPSDRRL
jgi:uncharacterized protein YbbK (DUF523 family)